MALTPGTRLGPYEVTAQIGVGGMGEVYRATDTNLKRAVAIKVLPASVAADAERLARFQREAEVLASLNHPNIAHIHGLEKSASVTALVMELVEGPTLADRIAQGAIPLDEALPIATQIAEALEAAHQQGIVHRDLKPANIKVRPDGTVKVLDFGLAKALEPLGEMSTSEPTSPTITTLARMTGVGMILGTAAYMSPDQARGKPVDTRADIWAFGCVLYEMLTGKRAFPGEHVTDTLAAVVKLDPKWDAVAAAVPSRVLQAMRVCLQKDLRQRAQAIGDVRLALEGAFETAAPQATTASSAPRGRLVWTAALGVAAVVIVALAVPALRYLRETPPPETRVEIVTPATDQPSDFALSPDGRQIVFVASGDGASRLWLRSLATTTPQPLAGTEGATFPFWAPDNRAIGFFTATALKRLDLGSGAPQTLAPVIRGSGGTWHASGVIVFAPGRAGPLMRVSASGGEVAAVTTIGPQQLNHRWPHALPDGYRFLFHVEGAPETTGIYLGTLDGSTPTRVTPADSAGVYLPAEASRDGGWLLWVRAGTLVAQRLDVAQAALTGEPVTLADGMALVDETYTNRSDVSVAATGLVAYRTRAANQRQLTWVDPLGTARGTVGDPDGNNLLGPRVSPDGRRVAVSRTVAGNTDIWLLDGARMSRVTFDAASDRFPLWSPDGTRIVFGSSRSGRFEIYEKLAGGAGVEERLVPAEQLAVAASWSPDGRFLLYINNDPQTNTNDPQPNTDLWVLPMAGNRTPSVFLKTPFADRWGTFSPDGRWVAYHSSESGQHEVYLRPFIPPGTSSTAAGAAEGQRQVSTAGGVYPVWRPDGRELYYLDPESAMMAVPITVTGATLEPGAPVVLFSTRILGGGVDSGLGPQYDVAPDGRFLINTVLDSAAAPITLLMNWNPDVKK